MYAALDKDGTLTYAKVALMNQTYYCCHCDKKVKLIMTETRKYFRHTSKSYNGINERLIHQKGKKIIMSGLQQLNFQTIESELYLPKIQQRPDILVDHKLAFEYQCAKIDVHLLNERVQGYSQLKLNNIWIIGGSYLDDKIKRMHLKFINFNQQWQYYLLMLDSLNQQWDLFHHIQFLGPFNKIFFQKQSFPATEFVELLTYHPPVYQIAPQLMTPFLLQKLRQKNDQKSQWVKLRFYQKEGIPVEDYLRETKFPPIPPIYRHPAWQMVCKQEPKFLMQPLLQNKRPSLM